MSETTLAIAESDRNEATAGIEAFQLEKPLYARRRKRAFDIVGACLLILLLSPVLLVLYLLVRLDRGPALYRHRRLGARGKTFPCMKFRSMRVDADTALRDLLDRDEVARAEWASTFKLKCDPRVTRVGRVLRKTSLDELPQLFNVLAGDMSLVGPRPIVESEIIFYGDHYAHYMQCRPGLTGLWQVSGRSDTSYDRRVALDVDYIINWRLGRDIGILAQTPVAVIRGSGAY